jgi:putative AlgH/UPF0301 family transcriptional regulator
VHKEKHPQRNYARQLMQLSQQKSVAKLYSHTDAVNRVMLMETLVKRVYNGGPSSQNRTSSLHDNYTALSYKWK